MKHIECNECNGTGVSKKEPKSEWFCKCKGTGKINWIENIFGKEWDFENKEDKKLRIKNFKKYSHGNSK